MNPSKCLALLLVAAGLLALPAKAANYSLNLSVNGSGSVSKNPTNSTYPSGSVVTLTAVPDDGWMFSGWSGDLVGSANPINVTMDTNKFITASFQSIPTYTLSTGVVGQGTVDLNPPGGNYRSNSVVSVGATPATHWIFLQWSGADSGTNNPVNVLMDAAKAITATFVEPARITQEPPDASGNIGDNVTFVVTASGTGPLSYQWRFNTAPIGGANASSYTITNIQPKDVGNYSVVVSNSYGNATSRDAHLAVANGCSGTNVVSDCSESALRVAITTGGTITFCCNGTITLSNPIDVGNDVTLDATNHSVVISGNGQVRLFDIKPGAHFAARNLTFADGSVTGTNGTDSSGCPNCPPPGPGGPGQGGGFYNSGTLALSYCTLTNNQAAGGLGGILTFGFGAGAGGRGEGGAVYNNGGILTIDHSLVISNRALGGAPRVIGGPISSQGPAGSAAGGAVSSSAGNVTVSQSMVGSNLAYTGPGGGDVRGGGVFLSGGSNVISGSQLAQNLAASQSSTSGAAANCAGGAVFVAGGQLSMVDDQVRGNSAMGGNGFRHFPGGRGDGGGIYSMGQLQVERCTIAENSGLTGFGGSNVPGQGGGLYNGGAAVVISSSVYSNLVAGAKGGGGSGVSDPSGTGSGGGIFSLGNLFMTNATLALNTARAGFDMFATSAAGSAYGGGMYCKSGSAYLMNVSVASNVVELGSFNGQEYGTAAGANLGNESGALHLRNSLVAYGGAKSNAWGTVTDDGFNMSSDGSCQFASGASFNFTDPKLGPLSDNGGPTLTLMPQADSPALDLASPSGAPSVDQRGASRPAGAGYDMGSVERDGVIASRPALAASFQNSNIVVSFPARAGVSYEIQSSTNLVDWALKETVAPSTGDTNVVRSYPTGVSREFLRLKSP